MNYNVEIKPLNKNVTVPWELLLLADPSRELISIYLEKAYMGAAWLNGKIVGIYLLLLNEAGKAEIKNIAVEESMQGKGIGTLLLQDACNKARSAGFRRLRIGTGNSSLAQLALYQKQGFEMVEIRRNFFVDNYPAPIVENGIPCKHQVVLEKAL